MPTAKAGAQCRVPVPSPPRRYGGKRGWWGQARLVGAGEANGGRKPPGQIPSQQTSPGLVQSSPRSFWTGIGPVPNSVGLGLDWTGLAWTSPALCPGLGYISHCIGLLMGEIYLDGTEYTDRTVIISPRAGIQR